MHNSVIINSGCNKCNWASDVTISKWLLEMAFLGGEAIFLYGLVAQFVLFCFPVKHSWFGADGLVLWFLLSWPIQLEGWRRKPMAVQCCHLSRVKIFLLGRTETDEQQDLKMIVYHRRALNTNLLCQAAAVKMQWKAFSTDCVLKTLLNLLGVNSTFLFHLKPSKTPPLSSLCF